MLESEEDNEHNWREIMRHKHKISNDNIDEQHRRLVDTAGKGFTRPHGKCADTFGFIVVVLINVFADVDAGNTQAIGDARQHNIPYIAGITAVDERHCKIDTANDDGSPN